MDYQGFMDLVGEHFPNATVDLDNERQLIIYTNLELLTPDDNPTIPLGECVVQDMGDY